MSEDNHSDDEAAETPSPAKPNESDTPPMKRSPAPVSPSAETPKRPRIVTCGSDSKQPDGKSPRKPTPRPHSAPQFIIYEFNAPEPSADDLGTLLETFRRGAEGGSDDDSSVESDTPPPSPPPPPRTFCEIEQDVETLDDLIAIGELYDAPDYHTKKYSVNVEGLHRMIPALREFQEMVGLDSIKKQVVDQIVYLSGKGNHQQFTSKSACTGDATGDAVKRGETALSKRNGKPNPATLLSQLFSGLSDAPKRADTQQFKMSESVTHDDNAFDMFHTVIYGPPGVGKTAFAKVLARLFLNLGITQNDTFRVARRSDLIGEYVGHTATKTQKVIDEAQGGVLFIDEVYALGNGGSNKGVGDGRVDSFSTECINTLNQNLTERKGEFICIVAGYKRETEKYFFELNPGLRRRFSFYYTIDAYDWEELTKILLFKINKLDHWHTEDKLGDTLLSSAYLKDKMEDFPHYAGDVETWLLNIKIAHCKRVFGKNETLQRVLTVDDIHNGYDRYVQQKRGDKEAENKKRDLLRHLYM